MSKNLLQEKGKTGKNPEKEKGSVFKLYKYYFIAYFLLLAITLGGFAYSYFIEKAKQKEWLGEEFASVLQEEFEKYSKKITPVHSFKIPLKENENGKSATIQDEKGNRQIRIDALKEKRNISHVPLTRGLHSVLILKGFITPDSIYTGYLQLLKSKQNTTDITLLHIAPEKDSIILGHSTLISSSDSITSYCAGYGNEYEFILYGTPCISSVLSACKTIIIIIVLELLAGGILYFIFRRRRNKAILLPLTNEYQNCIYQIGENLYFNSYHQILYKKNLEGFSVKLNARCAAILKVLILADGHQLIVEQLKRMVWKEKDAADSTVRVQIKILNDNLRIFQENICIITIGVETYRLILPKCIEIGE